MGRGLGSQPGVGPEEVVPGFGLGELQLCAYRPAALVAGLARHVREPGGPAQRGDQDFPLEWGPVLASAGHLQERGARVVEQLPSLVERHDLGEGRHAVAAVGTCGQGAQPTRGAGVTAMVAE
jgi:hypothetical protein